MELIKLIDLKELMELTKFIELLEGDGVCGLVDLIGQIVKADSFLFLRYAHTFSRS